MNPPKTLKKQLSFAEAFSELEKITADLESDTIDLDAAIEKFERGLVLAQQLKSKLASVEQRVETIRKKFSSVEFPEEDAAEPRAD